MASFTSMAAWHQPMVPVVLAFGLGIALDRWVWGDTSPPALWIGYMMMGLAVLAISRWMSTRSQNRWALAMLFLSVLWAGAARHHLHWRVFPDNHIGRFASDEPQPICLEAVLSSVLEPSALSAEAMTFPEPKPFLRGVAKAVALRDGTTWRPVSGRVLLYVAGSESPYQPGDRLRIVGRFQRLAQPQNPGQFNLREYRRADRILAQVTVDYPEGITHIDSATSWQPLAILGRWRAAARLRLHLLLPESDHALAQALLLGFRSEIPDDFEEALLKTGTIHLLAISGLHVGILAGGFSLGLQLVRFPRRLRPVALLLVIVVYVALAGGQPSTVRASITLGLFLVGHLLYRSTFSINTLAVAAMTLLILNPSDLFRVGPQLSFLAASVLLVVQSTKLQPTDPLLVSGFGPPSAWARFIRSLRQRVVSLLLLSVTVWLITLPLVIQQFHILNPLSVILTPILVFPITVALLTGFLLILLGPVLSPLTACLAWLCHVSLSITESVIVSTCQNLPLYWWLPSPPGAWVMGFYVLWLVFLIWGYRGPRWLARPLQVGLSVWLLCGALFLAWPRKASPHEFRFTLLSVGHGLASVLELPNGEVWVYDVGSFGNHRRPAQILAGYLWSRGYSRIDKVVLSHADLDHFNGLPLLVDYFSVKKIVVSPQMFCRSEPALEELRRLITVSGIRCETVASGQRWDSDGCRLEVLHPPPDFSTPDDNAHSLLIVATYAGRRLLLPGDLEGQGIRAILDRPSVKVDALVSPHHGSVRGQAGDLVRWCRPRWLLVSGGQSSLESVKEHFQGQVKEILHTAETGAITLVFSSRGCEVILWNTL